MICLWKKSKIFLPEDLARSTMIRQKTMCCPLLKTHQLLDFGAKIFSLVLQTRLREYSYTVDNRLICYKGELSRVI